ncbi:hypothetical protein WICPIJ_003874 [Wickerhamomyces pijperi]|uniref:Uncharacterized protein n=1 Tax=Wickerhamomyces pijperi TaxID=599730 RepID=A0A9P8Q6C6_WICPI|nr:hypothetical protein WICPIJ_003874 [Wickerhamomyces pijperi]
MAADNLVLSSSATLEVKFSSEVVFFKEKATLFKGRDVQDTVGVDVEGDFDLWDTSWGWWDAGQFKLTQQVVVLGSGSFTFKDLDQDTWLVVGQVLGLGRSVTGQDGGLDSGTVGNSFIWVDGSVWFLTVEEFRDKLLNLWDSGGTTNQDDFVDLGLVQRGVSQDLFNWVQGGSE